MYEINDTGSLSRRLDLENLDREEQLWESDSLDDAEQQQAQAHCQLVVPVAAQTRDAKIGLGDTVIYKTYLRSVGIFHASTFLFLGIAFAITFKFPGKYSSNISFLPFSWSIRSPLICKHPDLWSQWWSNASTAGDTRGNGYWLGLYAGLEVLPLLTLPIWLWSEAPESNSPTSAVF